MTESCVALVDRVLNSMAPIWSKDRRIWTALGALALVVFIGWTLRASRPPSDGAAALQADDRAAERRRMIEDQLRARGIRSAPVLEAMQRVPRHLFVPEPLRAQAYGDYPLPIGHEQTISQPYIVAFMTESLDVAPTHSVLEIGTGFG